MDTRVIKYFLTVAQTNNITHAHNNFTLPSQPCRDK